MATQMGHDHDGQSVVSCPEFPAEKCLHGFLYRQLLFSFVLAFVVIVTSFP